ncbi:MAG: thioredoxin family protein [Planctomycetota bacterium]
MKKALPILCLLAFAGTTIAQERLVEWYPDGWSNALGRAGAKDSLVLVMFWAQGSAQCDKLFQETFGDPKAMATLKDIVCYSADTRSQEGHELVQKYRITSLPTMLFVKGDGRAEDGIVGFIPPEDFGREVERIKRGVDTRSAFEKAFAAKPADLEAGFRLLVKLEEVGDTGGARQVHEQIRAKDPSGATEVGARLLLSDTVERVLEQARGEKREERASEEQPTHLDLAPVEEVLRQLEHASVRFDGWSWVASQYGLMEECEGFVRASRSAWSAASDDTRFGYGRNLIAALYEIQDQLEGADRKFAHEVGRAVSKLAEARAESFEGCQEGCGEDCCGSPEKILASGFETLARAELINGEKARARRHAERAAQLAPESESAKALLAALGQK